MRSLAKVVWVTGRAPPIGLAEIKTEGTLDSAYPFPVPSRSSTSSPHL
ncbi:hypothetical protein [Streptomyces sp. Ag109_O5-1]|nr:hypothetical protein [Streptomyces sp. Ag109_O5-1]